MPVPSPEPRPLAADHEELGRLRAALDAATGTLQTTVRDTTRLTRILAILSEQAPLPVLLDRILASLSELFSSEVAVLLERTQGEACSPLAAIGLPEDVPQRALARGHGGCLGAAVRTRGPVVVPDAGGDPRVDPLLRELGVCTAAWLPIMGDGDGDDGVAAVLLLARCHPTPYAAADLEVAMGMGHRIGLLLERTRARDLRRATEERLLQVEKLALAGRLAGSVAQEASDPLTYVLSNLEALRQRLPAIATALRVAREAARFLAGGEGAEARRQAQILREALEGGGEPDELAGELTELVGDSLEGARRISRLIESLRQVVGLGRRGEAVPVDLRTTIAACLAELPAPAAGTPEVRQEVGDDGVPRAWLPYPVVKAAVTDLLRFLLAADLPRSTPSSAIVVREATVGGRPAMIITDCALCLPAEEGRSLFEPRTPDGLTLRLGLAAELSCQLLRGCGAELSTSGPEEPGLTIRILLPPEPGPPG